MTALLPTSSNVVSVCSGVRLPNSVVTNLVQPLTTTVGSLETLTNNILGNGLGLIGLQPVTTDVAGLMNSAGTGYTNLQAVSRNGTLIGPSASCYSSADGFTLTTPSGLSIGGNTITGLGDAGQNSAAAMDLSAIAFGNNATTEAGATDAIALGSGARVTASGVRSLALGGGASATAANSVALGAGSIAARGAQGSYTALGLGAGQISTGEVSVGTATARRQITNLAPGSADNDAVNVAQLASVSSGLAALGNLAVQYSSGTHGAIVLAGGPSGTLISNLAAGAVTAGSSDAVNGSQLSATNTTVATVSGRVDTLGTRLDGDEATIAGIDTRVTQNGTDIAAVGTSLTRLANGGAAAIRYADRLTPTIPNAGTPSQDVTLVGAAAGPVGVHNVLAGAVTAGSTDAINGDQLFTLGQSVAGLSAAAGLAVSYDDATRARVTLQGTAGAPVVLGNVAAGSLAAGSSEAVNGAQLLATNTDVGTVAGRVDVLGTRLDGDETTIAGIDTRVTQNMASIGTLTGGLGSVTTRVDLLDNGGAGPIRYSSAADPTMPNGGVPSQHVTLVGAAPGAVALHNVAPGVIGGSSSDAINGGQMQILGQAIAATLGGFTYNGAGNLFAGGFQYGGNTYADVQSVLGVISSSISSGPAANGKYFHANSTRDDSAAAGDDSTAIGPSAMSAGEGSVAMGRASVAMTDSAVAIGDNSMAMGGKAVSIGVSNVASGDGAVAIGDPNLATGDGAVALGKDNTATGLGAIALGNSNAASGQGAAAIGNINIARGVGAAAIGSGNNATGEGSIAIGLTNTVQGDNSIAIGSNVSIAAADSLAIGQSVTVSGDNAMALGNHATASGPESAAIGNNSLATGLYSSAFGRSSIASDQYALALGSMSSATALATTAIGTGAVSSGFAASSFGTGAVADQDGSVALGSASQTVRGPLATYAAFGMVAPQSSAGEIAVARNIQYVDARTGLPTLVGDRQITGVAAGSADSDAVNVAQLRGVAASLGGTFAASLGGGATYDGATGSVTPPSYTVNGVSYTAVGDALTALIATGSTGAGQGGAAPAPIADPVTYADTSHTDVRLAPGNTAVHNVAAGTVSAGSTDAVNGGQLASTEAKVAALAGQVGNGQIGVVRYTSAAGPTTPGGQPSNDAALVGSNAAAPVALHNVAAGQVAAGSTDAVNGGQLAATNQRVATVETTATQAMAMAQSGVQYTDTRHTSVTLGDGTVPVAVHNVADGTTARDAVNLGQLTSTSNAALIEAKSYTDARVAQVAFDLGKLRKEANAGTAGALAIAGMPQPYEAGRGMLSMGAGTFEGQSAIALGVAKALSDEHTVVKLGATYNSQGQVGANAGVGYQF